MKYITPEYKKTSFTCPHCGVIAEQKWDNTNIRRNDIEEPYFISKITMTHPENRALDKRLTKELAVSTCNVCHDDHIWVEGEMILPKVSNVPTPIEDMPEIVKEVYNEAREVFANSPKAAAALLRLAVQYLCIELGGKGQKIDDDIGKLVKEGLPTEIQMGLDVVRVIGNNAVHPGVIDIEDNKEKVAYMFEIINAIVDNQIVQKKKLKNLYNSLPQGALNWIEKRDK